MNIIVYAVFNSLLNVNQLDKDKCSN